MPNLSVVNGIVYVSRMNHKQVFKDIILNIMFINRSNERALASSIYYSSDQSGAGVKILDLPCFRKPVIVQGPLVFLVCIRLRGRTTSWV